MQTINVKMLRAARQLTGPRQTWWDHLEQAKRFSAKHGNFDFPKGTALAKWATRVRSRWRKGLLSAEQSTALVHIDFPRRLDKPSRKPTQGKKIDKLLSILAKQRANCATKQELDWARKTEAQYRTRYRAGQLSPKTGKILGFGLG
jgi:hypothetical protein